MNVVKVQGRTLNNINLVFNVTAVFKRMAIFHVGFLYICLPTPRFFHSFCHLFLYCRIETSKNSKTSPKKHWTKMTKIKYFQSKISQTYCSKTRQFQESSYVEIGNVKEFSQTHLELLLVVIKILQFFFCFYIQQSQRKFQDTLSECRSKQSSLRKVSGSIYAKFATLNISVNERVDFQKYVLPKQTHLPQQLQDHY